MTKASFRIFQLGLLLVPIYFFPSGGFQVFHIFILTSFLLSSKTFRINKDNLFLFLLCAVTVLVGLAQGSIVQNIKIAVLPLAFVFSFMVFSLCQQFIAHDKRMFLKGAFYAVGISAVLQAFCYIVLVYIVQSELPYRYSGFFNNPNQMGYFSLLTAILLLILNAASDVFRLKRVILGCALVSAVLLSFVSLSKASIVSVLFFLTFYALISSKKNVLFALLFLPLFGYCAFEYELFDKVDELGRVYDRLSSLGAEEDDSIMGRGYGRIIEYPEYIFFGAGEGGLARFDSYDSIHSTLGSILFSYGLSGFCLFIAFILVAFRRSSFNVKFLALWCVGLASIMAYGLTHVGYRAPYFWLFFSIPIAFTPGYLKIGKP